MGSPTIFKGSFVKFLKSRIEMFNNWKMFTDVTSDPTSVAQDATAGSFYIRSGTNQLYKKFDAGSSTNWKLMDQPTIDLSIDPLSDIDSMPDTTSLSNTGGTLTLTTTGSEVGFGFQGIKFVSTATAQVVERNSFTLPLGLRQKNNLGLRAIIKNNANWTVRLVDDTVAANVFSQTVNTANEWMAIEFSGAFAANSSSFHWEFESTAADSLFVSWVSISPDIEVETTLLVRTEDNGTSDSAVTTLRVPNGTLTVNSAGDVSLAPTITVKDIDGTPSIAANTIEFTNGTVTDQTGGVARVTIAGSSFPNSVRYFKAASQSFPDGGSGTIINFETASFDPDTLVTTGASWKYTAPQTGTLVAIISFRLGSGAVWAANSQFTLRIFKNGVFSHDIATNYISNTTASSFTPFLAGSTLIKVAATDDINFKVYQNQGTARSSGTGTSDCFVSIHYVE